MITLDSAVKNINRIGNITAKKLLNLGIETVEDLLFYFPFRYDDFSHQVRIADLKSGIIASISGRVEIIQNKKSPRKHLNITEALVKDNSGSIRVIWFNMPFLVKNIREGDYVSLAGRIEENYLGLQIISPEYEKINHNFKLTHTNGLVPVYNLTTGISNKQLRFLIKSAIGTVDKIKEWLPKDIIKRNNLLDLPEAIKKIHFPSSITDINEAKKRLSFNELFLIQLQSQLAKKELSLAQAPKIKFKKEETVKFVSQLPFKLTDAQKRVAWEIIKNLEQEKPMARLLEGDVGSGKTIVALLAILNVALNNKQSVLMVPTEILAKQHFESILKFIKLNIQTCLFTRSQHLISGEKNYGTKNIKQHIINTIKNGETKIVIGTHALLKENIIFKNLALAIIDEQHRFGVEQRKTLIEKGNGLTPHLLSMTATPIPRSLALALYGDLDLSIINEMPKNRKKILTWVVSEEKREVANNFIKNQIIMGRQVFVICPLIDAFDNTGSKSVKMEYERLANEVFPDLEIGMLHGKMKREEKEKIMRDFIENKIKILVSTSVIEVGIDIPNASVIMIEEAERFGLAQLHQFRGRVGRGEHQSYCFLFTKNNSIKSLNRLTALEKYDNGLALAKIDLKYRGPGEVYGTMQKGFPKLKIASLFDYDLMKQAKKEAESIVNQGIENYQELIKIFGDWEKNIHLE